MGRVLANGYDSCVHHRMRITSRPLRKRGTELWSTYSHGSGWRLAVEACLVVPLCAGLFGCGETAGTSGPPAPTEGSDSAGSTRNATSGGGNTAGEAAATDNGDAGQALTTGTGGTNQTVNGAGGSGETAMNGTGGTGQTLTNGTGGAGPATETSATTDGAMACPRPGTSLVPTYTQPDGNVYTPTNGAEGPSLDVVGVVIESGADSIAIDTCPPDSDCDPEVHSFSLETVGVNTDLGMPIGTLVRMQFNEYLLGFPAPLLHFSLVLTNAEEFGSSQNPQEAGERLWLAASTSPVFSPLVLEQGNYLCNQGAGLSYATYELIVGVDESKVVLDEGETKSLNVDSGPHAGNYRVTGLESYAETIDGPFHTAFVMTRE